MRAYSNFEIFEIFQMFNEFLIFQALLKTMKSKFKIKYSMNQLESTYNILAMFILMIKAIHCYTLATDQNN